MKDFISFIMFCIKEFVMIFGTVILIGGIGMSAAMIVKKIFLE